MAPKFDVLRGLGFLKVLNVAPELETSMAMPQRGIKFRDIASVGIALLGLYWFSAVFYRVFLSNLAIFPGPKLAAATGWYEAFFDLRSANFPDVLQSLHERYGKSRFTHDNEAFADLIFSKAPSSASILGSSQSGIRSSTTRSTCPPENVERT